ncbi:MAG: VWA domain-containing protein [Azoarcus sp.]|jgi:hypothetical protein|nr:VWA domain-containing protein [Azoarcus sp.]
MSSFNFTPSQAAADMGGPVIRGIKDRDRKLPVALSFVSLIDATGSSDVFNRGITNVAAETADYLGKSMGTLQLAMHITRDLEYDSDANFSLGHNLSVDDFKATLARISYEGGGDELETQLDAVQTIARTYPLNPSPNARRVIALFSSSGSKPTRDGKNAAQVAQELNSLGIKVIVIAPNDVNLHELANATGGISLELTNDPSPEDINRVTHLLTRTLTMMANHNAGGTMAIPPNNQFGYNGTQMLGAAG